MPATMHIEDARAIMDYYLQAIRTVQHKRNLDHYQLAKILRIKQHRLRDMCVHINDAYVQYGLH